MADTLIAQLLTKSVKEKFTKKNKEEFATIEASAESSVVGWIIWSIIVIPLGAFAAYLSWDANTLVEWDTIPKVIFSFFAFLTGISYLISYVIYKYDMVIALRKFAPVAAIAAPVVAATMGGLRRSR